MFKKNLIISILIFLFTNIINETRADNVKIILFVNDEVITNIDIKKESQYLKILNPNLNQINEKKKLELSKVSLINEIIKKDEISKVIDLKITDNKYLDEYFNNLHKKLNYQNQNEFLSNLKEKNTYTVKEIRNKLNIELFWNEIIYNKYNKFIKIDEQALGQKIKNLKNINRKEYNLSEIVFKKKSELSLENQVEMIKTSINDIGFENTANIYSISQNSKFGGKVGWIDENNLSELILIKIKDLDNKNITDVIEINNHFIILKINEIRNIESEINEELELKKLVEYKRNNELEKFSKIYFEKIKMNSLIHEN